MAVTAYHLNNKAKYTEAEETALRIQLATIQLRNLKRFTE